MLLTKSILMPLKRQHHQLEMHTTPADIGLPCSDACSNHSASTVETQAPDRWASIASSWNQMLQIWIWCLLRLWRTIASSHSDNKKNPVRTMLLPNQFRKAHAMPQVSQMADWSNEVAWRKSPSLQRSIMEAQPIVGKDLIATKLLHLFHSRFFECEEAQQEIQMHVVHQQSTQYPACLLCCTWNQ